MDRSVVLKIACQTDVDLGRIEKLRGHHDAANQDFLKALDLNPTNADAKKLAE